LGFEFKHQFNQFRPANVYVISTIFSHSVHDADLMPQALKFFHQMGADKTIAAGN